MDDAPAQPTLADLAEQIRAIEQRVKALEDYNATMQQALRLDDAVASKP